MDRGTFETLQRLNNLFPPQLREVIRQHQKLAPIWSQLARVYRDNSVSVTKPESKECPAWTLEKDPVIPEAFKELLYKKFGTVDQFLTRELTSEDYSIDVCTICQYLRLAKAHYKRRLGPISQELLWEKVGDIHEKIFGCRPTHRLRILRKLGLDSLPAPRRGRPPGPHQ